MALTLEDVRKVATLAQLSLDEAAAPRLLDELNGVLAYMERLQAVDTEGVAPMAHVHDLSCPLRDDEARPSLGAEAAVSTAPAAERGCFSVPAIIGGGGA